MENKLEVIAEVAQGYEGKIKIAKLMIDAAKKSNADSIKFQLVYADELATPGYKFYNFFKTLEMTDLEWREVRNYSKKKKIKFYLEIFGSKSLHVSKKLHVDGIKIHPTDLDNYVLLKLIRKTSIKKIFLGIGGAYLEEIKKSIKILSNKKIILLMGFQGYPTRSEDNNINRIELLKKFFFSNKNICYGFADHDINKRNLSNNASLVAIGSGCSFIEKHLTIKYGKKPLEDSESAYLPKDFAIYKSTLDNAFSCYNSNVDLKKIFFKLNKSELKYRKAVKKSLVANKDIFPGQVLNEKHFVLKRVKNNNAFKKIIDVKNKKIKKFLKNNQPITKKFI
jgi:N,N'-diacetyllegionaminate synthase